MSVSYTHLDVYKRQALWYAAYVTALATDSSYMSSNWILDAVSSYLPAAIWYALWYAAYVTPLATNISYMSSNWILVAAVSYTHLDVYKRQRRNYAPLQDSRL